MDDTVLADAKLLADWSRQVFADAPNTQTKRMVAAISAMSPREAINYFAVLLTGLAPMPNDFFG